MKKPFWGLIENNFEIFTKLDNRATPELIPFERRVFAVHSGTRNRILDSCEPCPSNGECYQGKLECIHGYRRHGKLCVEDRDINETAKKLSKWLEVRLCEAYAQVLCYGTGTVWVREPDIWNDLDGHELMIREFKCPGSLAEYYKPLICHIRQLISKHALIIASVSYRMCNDVLESQKIYLSARVEELYHQVCDMLEENALRLKSINGGSESWVVASWLRDHLLLPRERILSYGKRFH
ncbi:hypothetical protein CRYUN_Cryun12cG0018300 [Craigia yunnanensis]